MKDFVRVADEFCVANVYLFEYGSESHLNLLEGELDADQIYLLLFPVIRDSYQNQTKTRIDGTTFSGKFMLLKGADFAEHYFRENGSDDTTSKYTKNIEPLLDVFEAFGDYLLCHEFELNTWKAQDAVDVLDANKDGLWCTFNTKIKR